MALDVRAVRRAFPGIRDGEAYLDTAATAQKPEPVLERLRWAYVEASGNVHRGAHRRSALASKNFQEVEVPGVAEQ